MIGRKGIFFTIMTLFLSTLIISSADLLIEQKAGFESGNARLTALRTTSSLLTNLESTLGNYEQNQEINERLLPFSYTIDNNIIEISNELPFETAKVDLFFDFINAYVLFLNDVNYSESYLGFNMDLNVQKNSYWGGSTENLSFSVLPQYLKYVVDENNASFSGFGDFNESVITRIDLNLNVPAGMMHDFNRLTCSLEGYGSCPDNDYNVLNEQPYFTLGINDNNCSDCLLLALQKTVRAHIDSAGANSITLSCLGTDCNSSDITISLSPLPSVTNNGSYIELTTKITSNAVIDEFYFSDYNASVTALVFNARSERES